MHKLTEEQKIEMDNVFNEPLSDRSKPVPEDYNPPYQLEGEAAEKFLKRLYNYSSGVYAGEQDL